MSKLNSIATKILESNIYLTLATCLDNKPWASPLFYCKDDKNNFYFISQPNSRHIRYTEKNPVVSFAIFDSRQQEGTGNGVQGSGIVQEIKEDSLDEALKWYKTSFIELTKENLTGNAPYRLYKLIPSEFYVLDPDADTDERVKVELL